MAARLTDKQRKKIIADYTQLESYNAVAKLNGVSKDTVKRVVLACEDFAEKAQRKKEQNTADVLMYMETQRERVCNIIDVGLTALPERLENAKTASEITTALGTLIDKWTMNAAKGGDVEDLTPLADMLAGKDGGK